MASELTAGSTKRALIADNAKKLGGQTPAAIVTRASQVPGLASTAAALVTTKSATFALPAGTDTTYGVVQASVACDTGQKALSGGYSSPGAVFSADSAITSDGGTWTVLLLNDDTAPTIAAVYVVCLK
jgi:hypothetical protein